jgi:hypothetical protein
MPGYSYNQPYGGTVFKCGGHYGSTVFDPTHGGVHLEINICDECLKNHKERVIMVQGKPRPDPEYDVEPWNPEWDWEE